MDASEHQVFLAVQYNDTVRLYISDADGVNYTFSLDHIVTVEDWTVERPSFDIHAVRTLQKLNKVLYHSVQYLFLSADGYVEISVCKCKNHWLLCEHYTSKQTYITAVLAG